MKTVIVVSPALKYGSWGWFEDIISVKSEIHWIVVAYGKKPLHEIPNVKWICWPFGDYLKIGKFASNKYFLWVNFIYCLPAVIVAVLISIIKKPDLVFANGLSIAILLRPFKIFLNCEIWVGYHGYSSWWSSPFHGILKKLLSTCTGIFCNSIQSKNDLAPFFDESKIWKINHWADDRFFSTELTNRRKNNNELSVLYVGRTDADKFAQCARVMKIFMNHESFTFTIAGPKDMQHLLPKGKFVGYISDTNELANLYNSVDIVWAPADIDYLSRPGVEALASGTPVIISDIPAVSGKQDETVRIPRDLIPLDVGWVVDGVDDSEAISTLNNLYSKTGSIASPRVCREFAQKNFSSTNINLIFRLWGAE